MPVVLIGMSVKRVFKNSKKNIQNQREGRPFSVMIQASLLLIFVRVHIHMDSCLLYRNWKWRINFVDFSLHLLFL